MSFVDFYYRVIVTNIKNSQRLRRRHYYLTSYFFIFLNLYHLKCAEAFLYKLCQIKASLNISSTSFSVQLSVGGF